MALYKYLKAKVNLKPTMLYPARLPFRIKEEIKNYIKKQKLKESISSKQVLQEVLRVILFKRKEKATTRSKTL